MYNMQLYGCIQVYNPPLPINLYIMGVNNEYNSHMQLICTLCLWVMEENGKV